MRVILTGSSGFLGGHLVSGHVDAVGEFAGRTGQGDGELWRFRFPHDLTPLLVMKGSIAVDGISLTVSSLEPDRFTLWIIPHTWEVTNLRKRSVGDRVNVEYDMLAKHVERVVELMVRPELLQSFGGK